MMSEELVIQDGVLYLKVTEMFVSSKVLRGEYSRNQVYSHLKVEPAVPWMIGIPVGELSGIEAMQDALRTLSDIVTDVAAEEANKLEKTDPLSPRQIDKRVEVSTPVRTIVNESNGTRPSVESAAGPEPESDEDEYEF